MNQSHREGVRQIPVTTSQVVFPPHPNVTFQIYIVNFQNNVMFCFFFPFWNKHEANLAVEKKCY